jgi:chaperone modulatory protein CbpM
VSYALARPVRLDLEAFARATATHPDLIRRLVALGLVEAGRDAAGLLWFAPAQIAVVARIQRLRTGLTLNYAAVGLVIDLLDRITALEAALRSASPGGRPPQTPPRSADPGGRAPQPPGTKGQPGGRTWTRTT